MLQHKVLNTRKRRDRSIPCVAATIMKRKETNLSNCKTTPAFGLPNYLPENSTEDETSLNLHKALMKKEVNRVNCSPRKMQASMEATFADRRQLIVSKERPLVEIRTEYPALFKPKEVY